MVDELYLNTETIDELSTDELDQVIEHYGIKYRSGRYPYGSGDNPYQHDPGFAGFVRDKRASGFTFKDADGKVYRGDTAIAKSLGMSTTQFRVAYSMAVHEERSRLVAQAQALKNEGLNTSQIAVKMGYNNESSVRSLLNEASKARMNEAMVTADYLRDRVKSGNMIDVGAGVEKELGVSRQKLNEALAILEMEGYNTFPASVPQVTNPGKQTNLKLLCPPDTPYRVAEDGTKISSYPYENLDKIGTVRDHISYNNGASYVPSFIYPSSVNPNRVQVLLADDPHPRGGVGVDRDGLIEIRPGVKDLSLGDAMYSQVRILVGKDKYLKGMAVYADDLPDGVDIRFNSNKTDKNKALKDIETKDPNNPFGSLIKEHGGQSFYDDPNGKYTDPLTGKKQSLSAINKRADEGDWGEWSKKLPSQFLSKQSDKLARQQLSLSVADKELEYDEIRKLTNPVVKQKLLDAYAESCDYAAEHLQAAALPRQSYQVLVPIPSLKDTEVYAPNYKDGETVALIRFPHGGTFEIPIVKVNNKNAEAIKAVGKNPKDMVGINKSVANRLSGADFDGDTVMVIPCNSSSSKVKITSTHPLADLKDFDPTMAYGGKPEGTFKVLKKGQQTELEMGKISNLITDMTLYGAPEQELARAVKHSMVVIDAAKHKLDYKQSEIDNGIDALKRRYQGHIGEDGRYHEGASTIISRAKSEESVTKRQGSPKTDPVTGKLVWKQADDAFYVDRKTGKTIERTQKSTKMAETDDAFALVSDRNTPMERLYAQYANKMKALANQARLESLATKPTAYDPAMKKAYEKEVNDLKQQLNRAVANKPREREAQLIATRVVANRKAAFPDMTKSEIKKASQIALTNARAQVGSKKSYVEFTPRQWEAVQKGAVSGSLLKQLVDNANIDVLRELATPRATNELSGAKQAKIKTMLASGYTNAEIAESIGASVSTVGKYVKEYRGED